MEELFKYAIEGGSFGVSLFLAYILFKKFIKSDVIEPINEIKKEYDELKKSFTSFTERVTGFVFKIVRSNLDLGERVSKDINVMHNLLAEATNSLTHQTSQARLEASEALKKVNVLQETTDKLLKIASAIHEKNKSLETTVTKINEDLIFVKTKVNKDDS